MDFLGKVVKESARKRPVMGYQRPGICCLSNGDRIFSQSSRGKSFAGFYRDIELRYYIRA